MNVTQPPSPSVTAVSLPASEDRRSSSSSWELVPLPGVLSGLTSTEGTHRDGEVNSTPSNSATTLSGLRDDVTGKTDDNTVANSANVSPSQGGPAGYSEVQLTLLKHPEVTFKFPCGVGKQILDGQSFFDCCRASRVMHKLLEYDNTIPHERSDIKGVYMELWKSYQRETIGQVEIECIQPGILRSRFIEYGEDGFGYPKQVCWLKLDAGFPRPGSEQGPTGPTTFGIALCSAVDIWAKENDIRMYTIVPGGIQVAFKLHTAAVKKKAAEIRDGSAVNST